MKLQEFHRLRSGQPASLMPLLVRATYYLSIAIAVLAPCPPIHAADGNQDLSFGAGGTVKTDFGGAFDDIEGLTVRDDGRIIAVGTGGSSNRFAVARYLPNGSLDNTFSQDGKLIIDTSSGSPGVIAMPNNKTLLAVPQLSGTRGYRVMRLNNNGGIDTTFGVNGEGFIATGTQSRITSMVLQPDGKIIVAGYDFFANGWDWVVTRFNPSGLPDTTFGDNGRVVTNFGRSGVGEPIDMLSSVVVQPDGKILAGGFTSTTHAMSTGNRIYAMARYLSDGSLDPTFADAGKKVFTFTASGFQMENISDLHLFDDGTVLAASSGGSDTALICLREDGSLDMSFGTGGRMTGADGIPIRNPTDLFIDPLGRLVLSGAVTGGSGGFGLARLFLDGTIDPTFGNNGTFSSSFGASSSGAYGMAMQPDGYIVAGGYSGSPNVNYDWTMVRFESALPEPGSGLVLTIAAALLCRRRESRRSQDSRRFHAA